MSLKVPEMMTTRSNASPRRGDPETTHFVLGGDHVGAEIARRLRRDGHAVAVVDEAPRSDDVLGIEGDPGDLDLLTESGLATAEAVVVGTESDARNLLVAQLVRARFDVPRIVVLVHDPDRLSAVADAGHEPLCVPTMLSETVVANI
jgi:trk system potassium uptake protein TrkA